jgi:hypothetical protein
MGDEMRPAIRVVVGVWLVAGTMAAGQRHHFVQGIGCDAVGTVAATVAAGPLNYNGLNPRVTCPEPSS